jgi:PLP dependent protein
MAASIPENLTSVGRRIRDYELKYDRVPGSVRLIAVGKTHPASHLLEALAAGQFEFGENYLQEALAKQEQMSDRFVTWHFIGPIQSNKTRELASHFDWIHTLDREKIARRLHEHCPAQRQPLKILLQVNVSGETSKSGVSLAELPALAKVVAGLPNLALCGLMAIPAPEPDFNKQRAAFRLVAEAAVQLRAEGFDSCMELSMGMSQDMEAAIAEGATMVRIGTDIFGMRKQGKP